VTESLIREYIGENSGGFLYLDGLPGLHAEVLAFNHSLNKIGDFDGVKDPREIYEQLHVATYKVKQTQGQGDVFPACANCSGIIPYQVHVVTGRIGDGTRKRRRSTNA